MTGALRIHVPHRWTHRHPSRLRVKLVCRSIARRVRSGGADAAIERLGRSHRSASHVVGWDDVLHARQLATQVAHRAGRSSPDVRAIATWHLLHKLGVPAEISTQPSGTLVVTLGQTVL